MYDLVKQCRDEVNDFLTGTITITSIPDEHDRTYEYKFSQRQLNALIDLYWNDQFKSGSTDNQGLQKIFLNVGRFRTDVAEMQIDIDVSNYNLIPTGGDYWTPWFMSQDFMDYVREHDYGEVINDWGADLPRRGTALSYKRGDEIERLSVSQIMNTQDATSLKEAACSGGYVIIPRDLTPKQAEEYPEWNLGNLEKSNETQTYYERYGLITEADIEMAQGKQVTHNDSDNYFLGVSIIATDVQKESKSNNQGLLFAEAVDEDDFPIEEVHWSRQDGRWQGIGEMERNFQNQLAKNLTTYYRQKSMYWAGKRMWVKNTSEGPDNLFMEVKDGGAIDLGSGGQMTSIDTSTKHLGDFQAMDQLIDNAADQTSFTYEAATGDSPKAGTPYSLQVQVDNTLQKHFGKKKERFGAFLRRVFFEHQVEIFKKERRKEHKLTFRQGDDGIEMLREGYVQLHTNDRWLKERADGKRRPRAEIEKEVRDEIEKSPYLVTTIPEGMYDNAEYKADLILTGERRNLLEEITTLQTLIQRADAKGDFETADKHERELLSLTGRMPRVSNPTPAQSPQNALQSPVAPPTAPVEPVPVNP